MNSVQLLLIVGVGIAVTAVARRHRIEPGWVIVVLAAGASFIPGVPRLELESEFILAVVVPPLLYSATRGASLASFGANLRAIIYLGVVTVVLTAGVLGWLSSLLLPSIGLAAAFVLGTVLAPPDTITTVSHGDEIGLPQRTTSILTGESLVNDATALTLFTIAIAAVNGEHATWGGGFLAFLRNASIGLGIGAAFAIVAMIIRKRLGNPTLETVLVLLLPFTAFLVAEEAHASGILAVVAAAFWMSVNLTLDPKHQYPGGYRTRLQEEQVWKTLDFLLETFVFAYIGLQLKWVLDAPGLARTLTAAGVLLVAAIVFRMVAVFVLFGRWSLRHRRRERRAARDVYYRQMREARNARRGGEPLPPPTLKENVLVGWTGMRGILTLAAAAGIPEHTASGAPFPGRDAIQAIALIVTLGTLLIQGTTIGWLARRLRFDLTAERAAADRMRERGHRIVAEAAAEPAPDVDASFEAQRLALGLAVRNHEVTEEVARELIEDLDLRQAARHT
ncbi:putative sodium/proton antiporter [Actinoplanes missouriensis 431]|uniref:Putative sodium/proton antiporter n=1 Tax=Actinoplanes missouriensis (strain ATCC 14538 / DSM 43046 / CBS 188.64 / JCM 3121 / NBRC 102363 / NCIMB 12654 / NRRL B-3342 / UNCC 431) TaxID=512565 RepID=I0H3P5_ACTM4|nr:sodium:proton antiporter [Actinoplanes missouriensis]BAL87632.1 putative sodium/proton antiporter [Actinoplanes missouriensis 431]